MDVGNLVLMRLAYDCNKTLHEERLAHLPVMSLGYRHLHYDSYDLYCHYDAAEDWLRFAKFRGSLDPFFDNSCFGGCSLLDRFPWGSFWQVLNWLQTMGR